MLGYAYQKGLLPVSFEALDRAIEMNGVAVEFNRKAFALGRQASVDPDSLRDAVKTREAAVEPDTVDAVVEHRSALLCAYQNTAYAGRYRDLVETVRRAEAALGKGSDALTMAVARNAAKLMAYKDEYEVARLYTDGRFARELRREFEGNPKLKLHLAPPILARRDPVTGEPKKREFGPWIMTAMSMLAKFRFLRGTALDPFGRFEERRIERGLIDEYEATMRDIAARLDASNHAVATAIAGLPDQIRGFGHIKLQAIRIAERKREELLRQFNEGETALVAAE
jgi:indolepyruvate ferredoxin oxidoreductase